jgi:hypothetical protein
MHISYVERMLLSKPATTLDSIAKLPPIWASWDDEELFPILGPEECLIAQLLLQKKIDRLTSFYENQMTKAAKLNKEEKKE